MIVAALALVFAMVGTAVAGTDGISSKLTKSKVKSIAKKQADKELKANVAGSHVNTADNATNATNATNANSASNANGVTPHKIVFQTNAATGPSTIFSAFGQNLVATCDGSTLTQLELQSTTENGRLQGYGIDSLNETIDGIDDHEFDSGESEDLFPADHQVWHLEFLSTGNNVLSIDLQADDNGFSNCQVSGTAFTS
jgi:hypothetical protein